MTCIKRSLSKMNPVPSNAASEHHKKVTVADFFRDRLPSLGIREIAAKRGWEKTLIAPFVKTCHNIIVTHHRDDAIMILSPRAHLRLEAIGGTRLQGYLDHLVSCKTMLVILAQCARLPDFLKNKFKQHRLPMAFSPLHENVLESRIKAIIQEKIKRCITVHGVVLEHQGGGILITGPSGIGKTTAAMRVVPEGYRWIADDRAVIKKNKRDGLLISGHPHIKNSLHTDATGIVNVNLILNTSQIKKRAVLTAIIDVIRTSADKGSCRLVKKNILGERLPCLRINIPGTGYLDKTMLLKAIQKLEKVG